MHKICESRELGLTVFRRWCVQFCVENRRHPAARSFSGEAKWKNENEVKLKKVKQSKEIECQQFVQLLLINALSGQEKFRCRAVVVVAVVF